VIADRLPAPTKEATEVPSADHRAAFVWRGARGQLAADTRNFGRLRPIIDAFRVQGIGVEPILYCDELHGDVRDQLLGFDAALIWIDPISGDEDRSTLDPMLREVAAAGVWVSAHPDTILKMGTKEVLYRTRSLGWGADTRMYATLNEFRSAFPVILADGKPRVLKQHRGNGGIGVWKVTPLDSDSRIVRVQHAAPRDDATEDVPLTEFMDRCEPYFNGAGKLIDQPFATRLTEGMIRAYFVEREVVGFARQQPTNPTENPDAPDPNRVLGMPSAKTMYPADEPQFRVLRSRLEREWLPGLQRLVRVTDDELPALWDADFLYGSRTEAGDDTYMLCEINASSVIPFPDALPAKLASAVERRCALRGDGGGRTVVP
jgi:hypothetical protein